MFAFWNEKSSYELLFHIATYSRGKEKNAQNKCSNTMAKIGRFSKIYKQHNIAGTMAAMRLTK